MPNGAYPSGIEGSTNVDAVDTRFHVLSQTSTRPLWKSVAYKRRCPAVESTARPLYFAPLDPVAVTTAAASPPVQPRIFPSPAYNVEIFAPLSATQNGVVGPATRPQPLTRLASVNFAGTAPFETRFVTVYAFRSAPQSGAATTSAAATSAAATSTRSKIVRLISPPSLAALGYEFSDRAEVDCS